jgi:hypothetical protein
MLDILNPIRKPKNKTTKTNEIRYDFSLIKTTKSVG